MAGEIRTFEIPRGQVASLASGCKVFSVVFAILGITFVILTLPTHDAGLSWLGGIAMAMFILLIAMLSMEAHVFEKCLVWRAELHRDGVTLHTLAEQIFAPWSEIESIGKQACAHGHTQFILTCKRGEPYRLPATLDKTEQLFDQIRANITTPSLHHSMLKVLQFQNFLALPIVLIGVSFVYSDVPFVGWSLGVLSGSILLCTCMFLCLDYSVSEQNVKLRSLLAYYNSDWASVRTMKLASFVRTAQGCFFFSGWLLDHEMLKQSIRIRCANQRSLLTDARTSSTSNDTGAGYNHSGSVVALLALVSAFSPLLISAYVSPVAIVGSLLTFFLGKPARVISLLCFLVSVPSLVAPIVMADFVSPGKPAIARLIDAFKPGIDLSALVTTGSGENLFGYQLNPPVSMGNTTSISESGMLKKWRGRDIITGISEVTFMVAPEHASSAESGSARYEWSHPRLLSNITRVGTRTQEFDGLTFTINEWTATCGPINFYGFDYIANHNGCMIAVRSLDGRVDNARARAEAVMKTFHKDATAGIPVKIPASTAPSPIPTPSKTHGRHGADKSQHHKGKRR